MLKNLGRKTRRTAAFILAAAFIFSFAPALPAGAEVALMAWDLTLPSLKESFADYFYIGNIMEPNQVGNDTTTEMYAYHYNFVTAENAMKPDKFAHNKGDYVFPRGTDFMIDWALENDIKVHGHALVWHSQSARWLTERDGEPLTRAEAQENMEEYISAVAGHFAGKLYSWDVVNEAFTTSVSGGPNDDGWWKSRLRKTLSDTDGRYSWYAAYANGADEEAGESGADFIYDAFVFTRIADPVAILYYNDFNETEPGKREAIAQMTEELNAKWESDPRNTEPGRLLIEGLGMQAHYWTQQNNLISSVEATIHRFAQTGAIISITELDIPIGNWNNYRNYTHTKEDYEIQADLYKGLFEVFMENADVIERVTFWGKLDPQSWRRQGNPLLFDLNLNAKPAFHSIISLVVTDTDDDDENEEDGVLDNMAEEADPGGTEPDYRFSLPSVSVIMLLAGAVLIAGGLIVIIIKRKK
jgi:endo-1,4-beta-xylanase